LLPDELLIEILEMVLFQEDTCKIVVTWLFNTVLFLIITCSPYAIIIGTFVLSLVILLNRLFST
jgi:hypothetical protein